MCGPLGWLLSAGSCCAALAWFGPAERGTPRGGAGGAGGPGCAGVRVLEMKTGCQRCDAGLDPEGLAFICSFECTFCGDCARELGAVCPNCAGELRERPRRGPQPGAR